MAENEDWLDNILQDKLAEDEDKKKEDALPAKEEKKEDAAVEPQIPKRRLDAALARIKQLETHIAQPKPQAQTQTQPQPQAPTFQDYENRINVIEEAIADALKEGDKAKAVGLRAQQREIERYLFRVAMQEEAQKARQQAEESVETRLVVAHLEQTYPEFNQKSDQYSEELTNKVIKLHRAFLSTGEYTSPTAMAQAAAMVLSTLPKKEEDRKGKAVRKAVDTLERQPPSLTKLGSAGDSAGETGELDFSGMTEKEIEAMILSMPEKSLKRLRGDYRVGK